jgi:dipeptide/tripeptide permease
LNLIDAIVIVIMIPVMDKVLPILRRKFGWNLGPLFRIAIGFVIAGVGFVYVGVLQWEVARRGKWVGEDQTYVLNSSLDKKVSVWYQIFPYLIIGISEIFSSISSLEFAYAKAPVNMKAIVMSLNLLTTAVGSAIGLVMAPIFTPQNLMATFFAFSAGMLILAVIFFKYFKDEDFDKIELPAQLLVAPVDNNVPA